MLEDLADMCTFHNFPEIKCFVKADYKVNPEVILHHYTRQGDHNEPSFKAHRQAEVSQNILAKSDSRKSQI